MTFFRQSSWTGISLSGNQKVGVGATTYSTVRVEMNQAWPRGKEPKDTDSQLIYAYEVL